ncbi:PPOX class F420-dependent oxidoreductase [Catenulispora yoronensis]|uniref:PPOX class F420-dependent oxidoreductase n=1 Tax=Catenulispora yoronensis TaxID=450799 RepID=A0ABP5FWT8_9ACTN
MDAFLELLGIHGRGTLATLKRDGRPQLSIVAYAYDQSERVIRISITEDRAKTRNLRRDPRATFMVTPETYRYGVFDGDAELTPVAAAPDDAVVDELVEVYRAVAGEHPDWDEFRAAMVADRRLVLRIRVTHAYGIGVG